MFCYKGEASAGGRSNRGIDREEMNETILEEHRDIPKLNRKPNFKQRID